MTDLARLAVLCEQCERKTNWSVDWNAPRTVLASDGSGTYIASCAPGGYAAFIAAFNPSVALKLLRVAEAARTLGEAIQESIAGGFPSTWDAPYLIPAPEISDEADALRDALAALGQEDAT